MRLAEPLGFIHSEHEVVSLVSCCLTSHLTPSGKKSVLHSVPLLGAALANELPGITDTETHDKVDGEAPSMVAQVVEL